MHHGLRAAESVLGGTQIVHSPEPIHLPAPTSGQGCGSIRLCFPNDIRLAFSGNVTIYSNLSLEVIKRQRVSKWLNVLINRSDRATQLQIIFSKHRVT